MHFHAQNLNEDRFGNVKGSMFKHGRCWWGPFRAEWNMLSGKCAIGLHINDEGATLTLGLLLFSLYLGCSVMRSREDRECTFYFYERSVWFSLWHNPMESRRDDPWWKRMHSFHYLDFLLGRHKRTETEIESRDVLIPMPEGSYAATAKLTRITLRRPRWFARSFTAADIDIPKGVPFEGKGENSWDCGEDAIYSMYTPAGTIEEAVGKVVASALRDRRRYGTPSRLQPVAA